MSDNGRPKHPSGRPIHREVRKARPQWRILDDGYNAPKLRQKPLKDAIGFVHGIRQEDEDCD